MGRNKQRWSEKLRIATWNVEGFKKKTQEVLLALQRQGCDIAVLTETMSRKQCYAIEGPFKILHCGVKGKRGVCIAMTGKWRDALVPESHKQVSARISRADFQIAGDATHARLRVIGVYAPIAAAPDEAKEEFYEALQAEVAKARRDQVRVIMLGDWNARLPCGPSAVSGPHGNAQVQGETANSPWFRDFLLENRCTSQASRFRKGRRGYATHILRNESIVRRFHQIDHVVGGDQISRCTTDTRVAHDEDCGSDHRLLISDMDLKPRAWYPQQKKRVPRARIPTVKEATANEAEARKRKQYNEHVRTGLQGGAPIGRACTEAGQKVYADRASMKPWISPEIMQLVERKRLALNRGAKPLAKKLQRAITQCSRRAKRKFFADACAAAELQYQKSGFSPAATVISRTFGKKKVAKKRTFASLTHTTVDPVTKVEEVARAQEPAGKAELHTRFYEAIFAATPQTPPATPDAPKPERHGESRAKAQPLKASPLESAEIDAALGELRSGKSPGEDELLCEHLALLEGCNKEALRDAMKEHWKTGELSEETIRSLIAPLEKPGKDASSTDGWRPIALLSTLSKLFARCVYNRLKEAASCLSKSQHGFVPGFRATDAAGTLKNIAQSRTSKTYVNFVDLRQAFDTITRQLLDEMMKYFGIDDAIGKQVRAMYAKHSFKVRKDGVLGRSVYTRIGLKQGCVCSPLLFNLCLEMVMRKIDLGAGVTYHARGLSAGEEGSDHTLDHLDFADDMALLAEALAKVTSAGEKLFWHFKSFGLHVNLKKTKYLVFRGDADDPPKIPMGNGMIDRVDRFVYLGCELSEDLDPWGEIYHRLRIGHLACASLRKPLTSRALSRKMKARILQTFVLPAATWGCELWNPRAEDRRRMNAFWNRKARWLLGTTVLERIPIPELLGRAHLKPLSDHFEERRLRYYGHVARYPGDRWIRSTLSIEPEAKRRGRPQETWLKQMETELAERGLTPEDCKNRELWKTVMKIPKSYKKPHRETTSTQSRISRLQGRRRAATIIDNDQDP